MAHTEGRVARPERQWGCRRGTPVSYMQQSNCFIVMALVATVVNLSRLEVPLDTLQYRSFQR